MPESSRPAGEKLERSPLQVRPDGSVEGLADALVEMGVVEQESKEPAAEPDEESASEPEKTTPEAKVKIKWQGQEIEVAEKDLIPLAQQGYDYTKKTQALAEKERELAPIEGLAKQLQNDPRFAAYVYSYFNQAQASAPAPAPEKPPEDPVQRLRWELKNELRQELQQELQRHVVPLTQQEVINRTQLEVMKDPLYPKVQEKLFEYVQSLPPKSQKYEFMRLDQDPESYMEMYQHFRKQLVETGEPAKAPNEKAAVTRQSKVPLLESSGPSEPPLTKDAQRKERISKAKAKLLASGDVNSLAEWIKEVGISEMLKGPAPQ